MQSGLIPFLVLKEVVKEIVRRRDIILLKSCKMTCKEWKKHIDYWLNLLVPLKVSVTYLKETTEQEVSFFYKKPSFAVIPHVFKIIPRIMEDFNYFFFNCKWDMDDLSHFYDEPNAVMIFDVFASKEAHEIKYIYRNVLPVLENGGMCIFLSSVDKPTCFYNLESLLNFRKRLT